jgi:hypothetical protein
MNRTVYHVLALLIVLLLVAGMAVSAQEPQPPVEPGAADQQPEQAAVEPPELFRPNAGPAPVDPPGASGPALVEALIGTNFSFQGRLQDTGNPANGAYDLRFRLYDEPTGGAQVGPAVSRDDVDVANGLFTVRLDFGDVFDGAALFMEIGVRPGASTGDYTLLTPRQPLTPTPYAQYSRGAGRVTFNTAADGVPTGDGFRLRHDATLFSALGADALVIEKTDGTTTQPDGGVAFVNTGSDGIEDIAMVVRGNGDVGVGTSDPAYRLTVHDNNHQIAVVDADNANKTWTLSSHQASGGIGLWENGADGRLLVEAGGNVGIGTIDPVARLHVEGAANESVIRAVDPNYARINMVATNTGVNDVQMFIGARGQAGTNIGELGTISNHDLVFFTQGVSRMRIENDGDICIGAC